MVNLRFFRSNKIFARHEREEAISGKTTYHAIFQLLLAVIFIVAESTQANNLVPKPQMLVDKKEFSLFLDSSVFNCQPTVVARWKPQQPNYAIGVTDAYQVDVQIVSSREKLFRWEELWRWEDSRKCGKDTCVETINHPIKTPSSYELGKNMNILLSAAEDRFEVSESKTFKGVVEQFKDQLVARVTPPKFSAPSNARPHSRASQVKAPCAKVLRSQTHVANLTLSIVRRHP